MLFAQYERYQYARPPLVEVICQLRFPTILAIGAQEPAAFQEAVRRDFPQYAARQEQLPPKVVRKGNTASLEPQKPITNYNFVSQDGRWKLNLTQNFIALSTVGYQRWEDFATRLDQPLAQFIQIYQPAYFERIGLRYVNGQVLPGGGHPPGGRLPDEAAHRPRPCRRRQDRQGGQVRPGRGLLHRRKDDRGGGA